jgi:hypothetical protein
MWGQPSTISHVSQLQRSDGAPDSPVPPLDSLVPVWYGKWPIRDLLTIVLCSVVCAIGQSGAPIDTEGWELPNEAPTTPKSLEAIKGPPGTMEWYPSILWAQHNSKTPWPHFWFVRERFERVLGLWLSFWFVRSLLCLCAWCSYDCALVCVSTPLLTSDLIVIICVRRERLKFVEIPHTGILI